MGTNDDWRSELQEVVELMQDFSRQPDPHVAGKLYAERVRTKLVPSDVWLSISRRNLTPPMYKITRYSGWKEDVNPWQQSDLLPHFNTGLLGELIYANQPTVIEDLASRLSPDDPAAEYLRGMEMLVTLPQYDDGVALNMGVVLVRDRSKFPLDRVPVMVWMANLYGRATLNLVLRQELKKAYDALDRELKIVGEIQRSLLPPELPKISGLDLGASYQTSQRAGGDYYDFFPLPDGKWGIFIADVSGHGTPSAVVMAITHAIAHSHPGPSMPPSTVLEYVNSRLASRYTGDSGTFVTAFYMIYDPRDRSACYAVAGHNPPRWKRGDVVRSLDGQAGLPLGISVDERYHNTTQTLDPGDLVLLYTDGITEATSPTGSMFGVEGVDELLMTCTGNSVNLVHDLLAQVRQFTQDKPAKDDRTLLALRVL